MTAAPMVMAALLLFLVALVAGCNGDSSTRTGVPEVDAVVEAVLSNDREALHQLVRYEAVSCTTGPLEIGGPPECLPGEPDGTVIDALMVASCEGHYIRPEGLGRALDYLFAGKPKLYGVYQGSPTFLPGDHTAIFSVEGLEPGQVDGKAFLIDDGAIVWINFGCGESPEQLARQLEQQPSPTSAPTPGGGG